MAFGYGSRGLSYPFWIFKITFLQFLSPGQLICRKHKILHLFDYFLMVKDSLHIFWQERSIGGIMWRHFMVGCPSLGDTVW